MAEVLIFSGISKAEIPVLSSLSKGLRSFQP
jgi:hypothetical protein